MRRDLENRLFRAEATGNATSWADLQSARHRSLLRARVKICDAISESLDVTGEVTAGALWGSRPAAIASGSMAYLDRNCVCGVVALARRGCLAGVASRSA